VHLPPPCRWCGAVAVIRYAVLESGAGPRPAPAAELRDRPRFSCALHFAEQTAGFAGRFALVVVDPEFSAAALPPMAEDSTRPFPPIGGTVRRRPPVPPPADVEQLQGPALLRALADELQRQGFDVADLDDDDDEDGAR
jgi:hypothetical protein